MAELHAVHFLMIWTGAISVATKTGIIKAILAWMPAPPDIPDDVAQAMWPGLVNPGTWVMTRRDTQITWLIRFSAAWKELPGHRSRQALAADPWALKEFTGQRRRAFSEQRPDGAAPPGSSGYLRPDRVHRPQAAGSPAGSRTWPGPTRMSTAASWRPAPR